MKRCNMNNGVHMDFRGTKRKNLFRKGLGYLVLTISGLGLLYSLGRYGINKINEDGINQTALGYVQSMDTLTLKLKPEIDREYPVIGVDNFLFMQDRGDVPSGLGPGELRSAYREQFRIDNNRFGSDALDIKRGLESYIIRFDGEKNHKKIRGLADSLGYWCSR